MVEQVEPVRVGYYTVVLDWRPGGNLKLEGLRTRGTWRAVVVVVGKRAYVREDGPPGVACAAHH